MGRKLTVSNCTERVIAGRKARPSLEQGLVFDIARFT